MPQSTFFARPQDDHFPKRLSPVRSKCEAIDAIGPLSHALDHRGAVAIVGTRAPSDHARRYTRWVSSWLAARGVTIVSGGALGVDAIAHEAALDVGGRTIAVLPCSLDVRYPQENQALFERIAELGALVAIYEEGARMPKGGFAKRNAVIAALADDVLMIAGDFDSGARITMGEALKLGRRRWVVPGAPWDRNMAGCALELCRGAHALINPAQIGIGLGARCDEVGAKSVIDVVVRRRWNETVPHALEVAVADAQPPPAVTSSNEPASPSILPRTVGLLLPAPRERAVLEALQNGPSTLDALVLETGVGVGDLRALLLTWTVEGVVREGPPGRFQLSSY